MAKVWYLGHSCLRFEFGKVSILVDPFIRPNPLAENIDYDSLKADYILVTHGHHDHMADLMDLAENTGALVIANYEICNWVNDKGYTNTFAMNIGGNMRVGELRFKMTSAVHSSVMADGTYAGNPGGFVISAEKKHVYIAGDTALTYEMKLIGEEYDLDLAVLPLGDVFTMDAKDACRAAEFVNCTTILGVHYDTFPPITINHEEVRALFDSNQKQLHLIPVGSNLEF